METIKEMELRANKAAHSLMGKNAWPTVLLAVFVLAGYVSTLTRVLTGHLSLLIAFLITSFLTYAIYTVLHDAVHGSINGKNKSLGWLNDGLGYLAGQMMFISFRAHQKEHLAHHRETNKPSDPDMYVHDDSLWSLIRGTLVVLPLQYHYYLKNHWKQSGSRDNAIVIIELTLMIGWRLAIVFAGFWQEALVLFIGSLFLGIFSLVVLFVWLVHRPHDETARYKNTNTIVFPKWIDPIVSWLWLFQNYHSIHHLFPRVPFYHYKNLYNKIEDIMVANDALIIRVGQNEKRTLPMTEKLTPVNRARSS